MKLYDQLISSFGWEAVVLVDTDEGWATVPLVAWALVSEDAKRGVSAFFKSADTHVVGLVAHGPNVMPANDAFKDSLAGYLAIDADPTDAQKTLWKEAAGKLYPKPEPITKLTVTEPAVIDQPPQEAALANSENGAENNADVPHSVSEVTGNESSAANATADANAAGS